MGNLKVLSVDKAPFVKHFFECQNIYGSRFDLQSSRICSILSLFPLLAYHFKLTNFKGFFHSYFKLEKGDRISVTWCGRD